MTEAPLAFAFGGGYDRILDVPTLARERGIELGLRILPSPKDAFAALAHDPELAGGEMSVSFYLTEFSRSGEMGDLVALPIWVSRSFRHSNIYVRADSALVTPAELAGRRVGLPEYGMTMAVWLRGLFADEYGVNPSDIEWLTHRSPAALAEGSLRYPDDVTILPAPAGRSWRDQLLDGSVDAWIGAGEAPLPSGLRRLFRDSGAEERGYFGRTGVFPIMHVLVMKRSVLERDAGLAQAVCEIFDQAKRQAQLRLWSTSVPYVTLPWVLGAVEEQSQLAGRDPWPYGVAQNLATLQALVGYMHTQGLLWTQLDPGDGFLPFEPG